MAENPTILPAFEPFVGPSRYKAAFGGRGSGKSHFFATAVVVNSHNCKGLRTVCVREVQKSLKDSAKQLIEDKIRGLGLDREFNLKHDSIGTPGGGTILFQGMQDHTAESVKSLEGVDVAWVEEAHTLSERSWEILRPTIRKPSSEIWASWNPRSMGDPVDRFFRGETPPDNAIIRQINFDENEFFPAELEAERKWDEANNRDRYAHIWLGAYEPMAIGAIWDRQTIHANRRAELPVIERIVVGVDPAVSAESGSDEHGIVVCGLDETGHGWVLDDVSTKGTPTQWANRVLAAFDRWEADHVVIEVNQGGDMVRNTLHGVRPGLPVKDVRATKGKHVRAEPIAALYPLGRVSHYGTFEKLEDQMCQMTAAGYEGEGSPDRCDAMVWAMTDLFPAMAQRPSREQRSYAPPVSGGWMA